ncbi:NAD(P)/FAD-dependent oxidoreductase [Undibacter mobilis]|uniref:TIGR03862 family flavoprotein n=1 Tax=Undibacter mobilis TaxID=2292256 RepID=A0A371B7W4_9BRAD|nr:TIGR03862 family flavoprotein [Undibacter mobilis]RDV03689.1 TIGR03862 family flavoprotein [Undibacter mobilis]
MSPSSAPKSKNAAVIGGGPAGLIAAETLARAGIAVTVYDQMPSLGRKLLMAGRGGLNLTHSEPLPDFLKRYGDADELLLAAVSAFPPAALRAWADELGADTFVGSSGRVFPKALKTSPLLRTWLLRLRNLGVTVKLRHRWEGWDDDGQLRFSTGGEEISVNPDVIVLATGGASWPKLGSDGRWVDILREQKVAVAPLQPANCGFTASWSDVLRGFAGQPLKRIAITFGERSARGEAMMTQSGIEGGAIYALSSPIRDAITKDGAATITVDLLPDVTVAKLTERLSAPRGKQSLSNFLRKNTHLAAVAVSLLHEAALAKGAQLSALPPAKIAALIKAVPVKLTGVQPIETAISSAGGIRFSELDAHFMLKKSRGVFVAGEMLDWDAPTGGYLLQASFATGVAAATGAIAFLRKG